MFNLFSSGTKYQQLARQNNCNLVEANGCWHLYKDGTLVAHETTAQKAIQYLKTQNV
jgi:hypothetical protein